MIENVDIFSLFGGHSEYIAEFINVIIRVRLLQYKIAIDIAIFSYVLKPD